MSDINLEKLADRITNDFSFWRTENQVHPRMFNYYNIFEEYLTDYVDKLKKEGLELSPEQVEELSNNVDIEC